MSSLLSLGSIPLVLGPFYYTLPQLISDPTSTLIATLGPLAAIQLLSLLVTPLPLSTSGANGTDKPKPRPSASKRGKPAADELGADGDIVGRIVPALLSIILSTTYATPLLLLLLILFGAPVTTHHIPTLLTAAHMALLATPGLFYAHGLSASTWRRVLALDMPLDDEGGFAAALGTLVGAWLGAVPIPLDWDREWQRWPVTIVVGAYAGWAGGRVLGRALGKGRRVDLGT